jgi:hypothetical protein
VKVRPAERARQGLSGHGRRRTWLKVKNPASPAAMRIEEGSF